MPVRFLILNEDGRARVPILHIDRKRRKYFDAGVRLLWVAETSKKTIKVYTSCNDCVLLGAADTLDGGDVLPGFKLSIREWYAKAD